MSLRILCAVLLLTCGAARAQEQSAYNADTPVEKIAADPAAAEVLNKDIPGLLTDSQYSLFKGMSLKQLHRASNGELSTETVDKAVADLQALSN